MVYVQGWIWESNYIVGNFYAPMHAQYIYWSLICKYGILDVLINYLMDTILFEFISSTQASGKFYGMVV